MASFTSVFGISLVLILLSNAPFGSSLKCHQCTSFYDAQCADPFHYEPTREGAEPQLKTTKFLQECPNDGKNYTLCRKIYQYVRGDERIIRSCGYEEYKRDCYQTVLEEYNTYVCQCKGDGCNAAVNLSHSFVFTLTLVLVSGLFKFIVN